MEDIINYLLSVNRNAVLWTASSLVLITVPVAGIIIRKLVFYQLSIWSKKTETQVDDILVRISKPYILCWSFLLGFYLAGKIAPLNAPSTIFLTKSIITLFIATVTLFAAAVATNLTKYFIEKSSLNLPLPSLTENFLRIIIIALGGLIILSQLGISITPLLTALGVGSLAVALALQDTLTNLFSGFYILANKQIRPGDYIKLDSGHEGHVIDIGWRSIRIKELPNNLIIVPNSKVASAIVTNYNYPVKEMSVVVQAGVSYSSDLEKVEKVTIEVARAVLSEHNSGVKDFTPAVRYHTFGDSSINFSVVLRVKEFADQYVIIHEFIKRLHKRYSQEGIDIPFPQRVVHTAVTK